METTINKKFNWLWLFKNLGIAVSGLFVGNIAGGILQRASGVAGLATSGLGFYLLKKKSESEWIGYFTIAAGAGMITSPIMNVNPSSLKGLDGMDGIMEDAKEGSKTALLNFSQKFFLDKTPLASYLTPATPPVNSLTTAPSSLAQGTPINGLGVTEEEANAIIDEMIRENEVKLNGTGEEILLNGSDLLTDFKFNGTDEFESLLSGSDDVLDIFEGR